MVDFSKGPKPGMTPVMMDGGNISVATAGTGTNYAPFAQQALAQLTIVNDTGTALEFQQDGTGVAIPIADGSSFSIFGIHDAVVIGVRRKDTANTPVTVKARWEK